MPESKENILFVCSANMQRSPTAEEMYQDDERYEVNSCGTMSNAIRPITQDLVDWADRIFVMNEKTDGQKSSILRRFGVERNKIVDLDIPDVFYRGDPRLKELLRQKLDPLLG